MKKIIAWIPNILWLLFLFVVMFGCYKAFTMLVVTEMMINAETVSPNVLRAEDGQTITTRENWKQQRQVSLAVLEAEEYGVVPTSVVDWEIKKSVVTKAYGARATYELWTMSAPTQDLTFHMVVLLPDSVEPAPLLLASNFCPNHTRWPEFDIPKPAVYPEMCEMKSWQEPIIDFVMGEYLNQHPYEEFVERSMIFANIYLAEGVADDPEFAAGGLNKIRALTSEEVSGALAAWAWTYNEALRILEADQRIDVEHTAIYGHSRDGKAALLAAAYNESIDLVLAHQSGKGGAALWQRGVGESIEAITEVYPHWFDPTFSQYVGRSRTLPFDQHHLIASIAPRPVLLSTAWLDKWGDPAGTLQSAYAATPAYELYGASGISNRSLEDFAPWNELAFYIRPYNHGVRQTDWDAFFTFIDHHFAASVTATGEVRRQQEITD